MINETKRNIEAYKALLPGLKERVAAVALMLVMSVVMMTSATYAWLTISRAPEVQGMNTTITGNGNLEIALVGSVWDEAAKEYVIAQIGESAIGDSAATNGKDIMDANIAWGNLINLSDSRYGLSNIMLRPALLSSFNLMKEPLYGVVYSDDGRIEGYSDKYGVGSWTDPGNGKYYFAAGSALRYGVRAIGVKVGSNATADAKADAMMKEVVNAYDHTVKLYSDIIHGVTTVDDAGEISCMKALSMLVEIYTNERANNAQTSNDKNYDYSSVVTYMYRLMEKFKEVLDSERETMRLLANVNAYKLGKGDNCFPTLESLTTSNMNKYGVSLRAFSTHLSDYNSLVKALTKEDSSITAAAFNNTPNDGVADHASLKTLATMHDPANDQSTDPVYWSAFSSDVAALVNVGTTEVNGLALNDLNINNISQVLALLNASKFTVVIKGGAIQKFEQRIGNIMADDATKGNPVVMSLHIEKNGLVSEKYINDAQISTSAVGPFLIKSDIDRISNIETDATGEDADWSIGDTYGLALDFWVRTNGDDVNLILEGKVLYDTVDATTTDKNGNKTTLYTMVYEEDEWDVYQLEGTQDWYDANSHSKLGTNSELISQGYAFEKQTKEVVVGFRGENRVWEDWEDKLQQGLISEDSTTQGAGSCYVFYADSETDQMRILKLLEAFVISFVNQDGSELAKAMLDTENAYAINGKVTVPLKLVTGTLYEDANGKQQYAITPLVKNQATWISAIVYLDGTRLTNKEVLSVGEIEGSLNLQFGSDVDLNGAKDDDKLGAIYRTFSAIGVANGQPLNFEDSSQTVTFDYDGAAKQATITLVVDGEQPSNVSGFFTRKISETQGSRTNAVEFVPQADGTWKGTFDISKPGRYSFRSIQADGVEYTLKNCPTFEITGMSVNHVETTLPMGVSMTSDNYMNATVKVGIDVDPELMPRNVRAKFRSVNGDGKEFSAILAYKNGLWEGTAHITSSGTYELRYVTLDGEDWDLEPQEQHVVYLGVTAVIKTDHAVNIPFEGQTEHVELELELFDDMDKELENWSNVTLYYANAGSDASDDGLDPNMVWDAESGTYKATMLLETAGVFKFAQVLIAHTSSTSAIYTATEAPVFTVIPKKPPQYDSFTQAEYQFAPDNDASMTVAMYYAQAADVWALMVNPKDASKTQLVKCMETRIRYDGDDAVDPECTNYYNFVFDMPGDGEWVITKLCFQKVYVDNEMFEATDVAPTAQDYEESCYVIDVTAENIYSYVVETVNVITTVNGLNYSGSTIVFGKDANGNVVDPFMTPHNVENVVFKITDWNGKAIPADQANAAIDMLELQCSIHFDGDSITCGGYSPNQVLDDIVVSMKTDSARIQYTFDPVTLQQAGNYTMTLGYTYGGQQYYLTKINYQVWSIAPTVKITDAEFASKNGGKSEFTDTSATVYYQEGTEKSCGITYYNYTPGSVTILLTGYGNAAEARLEFTTTNSDGKVHLYEESQKDDGTSTNAYIWSADGSCKRHIGYWESKTGSDEKIPAGTLTATTLTLTYDGKTYTVTVPTITISNPS